MCLFVAIFSREIVPSPRLYSFKCVSLITCNLILISQPTNDRGCVLPSSRCNCGWRETTTCPPRPAQPSWNHRTPYSRAKALSMQAWWQICAHRYRSINQSINPSSYCLALLTKNAYYPLLCVIGSILTTLPYFLERKC